MKTNSARTLLLISAIVLATLAAIGCTPQPAAQGSPTATPTPAPAATPTPEANQPPRQGNDALTRLGIELGMVGQASTNSLTLRTRAGVQTVSLSSNTVVVIPGQASASVSDLARGDRVLVKKNAADQTAALVMAIPANATLDNLVAGQVQSVTNGSIALRTKNGSETMTTDATTVVVKLTADQASLGTMSDLQNGGVALIVRPSADSTNAQVVLMLDRGGNALSQIARDLLQKKP